MALVLLPLSLRPSSRQPMAMMSRSR
ncbi:hypothetical protein E2C01_042899 [Portunus trituberculatus]|uniref:Uncharacterized protein n=1 Tax=Portunus trituberculatus TaxID=210409 RepID=A0A5B7FU84_PORTR|nr:hypothetical protein [Portunus trituberculatus]